MAQRNCHDAASRHWRPLGLDKRREALAQTGRRHTGMMQDRPIPILSDLVLIGGGHAHALFLRMWGMAPLPGVRLTVINPGAAAPYTGMLPGHIAGHYRRDEIMIDLVRLARFAGARVILDRVTGIDRMGRRVLLQNSPSIAYDMASIDIGISSDLPGLSGFDDHAVAAKPLGGYAARWEAFVAQGLPRPRVVVVGAGVGGAELALASHFRLTQAGAAPEVVLLEQGPTALPGIGAGARARLLRHLDRAGIRLITNARVTGIGADHVALQDAPALPSDFTLAVAGARPQDWLAETGLALQDGFVAIGPTLQSTDPLIFAAGDCAHLTHAPRPKAGVFAVRQAPVLFHNIRAALTGGRLRPYWPQRDYLKLISTGGKGAVADKWGLPLDGGWLWRWKDRIDRKFMAMFEEYPAMRPSLPDGPFLPGLAEAMAAKPMCAGCGAKMGSDELSAALASLPAPQRAEVVSGPGDDAAILKAQSGFQVITTDHLRSFTHDARLMSQIAALHALGDIWAMGAKPQVALAQVTLPHMSAAKTTGMLEEIMLAASAVFRAAGADIVGGHSSIGAELTVGFTVTGLTEQPVTKGGAAVGDAVILTKPLGVGTILAAEMAMTLIPGLILGEAVAAALVSMTRPLGPVAMLLAGHAHAMTDVTGFGLAGHLLEILDASSDGSVPETSVGAELRLDAIPLLSGALMLAEAGIASSLAPANRGTCVGRIGGAESPRKALLFDPQTGGGLLAVVAADQASAVLAALQDLGEEAAIIGRIIPGPARITLV